MLAVLNILYITQKDEILKSLNTHSYTRYDKEIS